MLNGKNILITGGTGTFGKQFVKCKDLVSILVDSYVEDLEG